MLISANICACTDNHLRMGVQSFGDSEQLHSVVVSKMENCLYLTRWW